MIKLHSITNIYDLIDNLTDRHHRITISFSELKNSWNAFDLNVVETDLSKKLVNEPVNSFERSFTEIYTINNYYKTDKKIHALVFTAIQKPVAICMTTPLHGLYSGHEKL